MFSGDIEPKAWVTVVWIYRWLHSVWLPLTTSSDIIFNLLLISLPKLRSQRHLSLYHTTAADYRWYKKTHNNKKKSKDILVGREQRHRARGFVPLRGFPLACTRTALSWSFGHRFGPVQASPTMCASRLSRVKLAVICDARSAPRQQLFKLRPSLWTHPLCPKI